MSDRGSAKVILKFSGSSGVASRHRSPHIAVTGVLM
jgi:hypothetical protein